MTGMNPGFGEVMTCESERLTGSESRREAIKRTNGMTKTELKWE